MKNLINIGIFIFLTQFVFSQQTAAVDGNKISLKEVAPVWPGCEESELSSDDCFNQKLNLFVKEHYKFPKDTKGKLIRGKATVTFIVNKKGKVSNISVQGPEPAINKEATRIVELLPTMTPGRLANDVIEVKYKMPINF